MARTQQELEDEMRGFFLDFKPFTFDRFVLEQFSINSGSSTVVNTMSTMMPSTGVEYHGVLASAGGGYVLAPAGAQNEPKQYSRAVLRKLEKLASGPLDDAAPEGESEFMDWLSRD
jgi:hypothetical protein